MIEKRQPIRGDLVGPDVSEPEGRRHLVPPELDFVHPLSAIVTVSLDCIWTIPDLLGAFTLTSVVVCAVIFVITAPLVTTIQLFVERDSVLSSMTKGLALGIVAAVPLPVTPVVGTYLLVQNRRRRRDTATG